MQTLILLPRFETVTNRSYGNNFTIVLNRGESSNPQL